MENNALFQPSGILKKDTLQMLGEIPWVVRLIQDKGRDSDESGAPASRDIPPSRVSAPPSHTQLINSTYIHEDAAGVSRTGKVVMFPGEVYKHIIGMRSFIRGKDALTLTELYFTNNILSRSRRRVEYSIYKKILSMRRKIMTCDTVISTTPFERYKHNPYLIPYISLPVLPSELFRTEYNNKIREVLHNASLMVVQEVRKTKERHLFPLKDRSVYGAYMSHTDPYDKIQEEYRQEMALYNHILKNTFGVDVPKDERKRGDVRVSLIKYAKKEILKDTEKIITRIHKDIETYNTWSKRCGHFGLVASYETTKNDRVKNETFEKLLKEFKGQKDIQRREFLCKVCSQTLFCEHKVLVHKILMGGTEGDADSQRLLESDFYSAVIDEEGYKVTVCKYCQETISEQNFLITRQWEDKKLISGTTIDTGTQKEIKIILGYILLKIKLVEGYKIDPYKSVYDIDTTVRQILTDIYNEYEGVKRKRGAGGAGGGAGGVGVGVGSAFGDKVKRYIILASVFGYIIYRIVTSKEPMVINQSIIKDCTFGNMAERYKKRLQKPEALRVYVRLMDCIIKKIYFTDYQNFIKSTGKNTWKELIMKAYNLNVSKKIIFQKKIIPYVAHGQYHLSYNDVCTYIADGIQDKNLSDTHRKSIGLISTDPIGGKKWEDMTRSLKETREKNEGFLMERGHVHSIQSTTERWRATEDGENSLPYKDINYFIFCRDGKYPGREHEWNKEKESGALACIYCNRKQLDLYTEAKNMTKKEYGVLGTMVQRYNTVKYYKVHCLDGTPHILENNICNNCGLTYEEIETPSEVMIKEYTSLREIEEKEEKKEEKIRNIIEKDKEKEKISSYFTGSKKREIIKTNEKNISLLAKSMADGAVDKMISALIDLGKYNAKYEETVRGVKEEDVLQRIKRDFNLKRLDTLKSFWRTFIIFFSLLQNNLPEFIIETISDTDGLYDSKSNKGDMTGISFEEEDIIIDTALKTPELSIKKKGNVILNILISSLLKIVPINKVFVGSFIKKILKNTTNTDITIRRVENEVLSEEMKEDKRMLLKYSLTPEEKIEYGFNKLSKAESDILLDKLIKEKWEKIDKITKTEESEDEEVPGHASEDDPEYEIIPYDAEEGEEGYNVIDETLMNQIDNT